MKRLTIFFAALLITAVAKSEIVPVYRIQGEDTTSSYAGSEVETEGVVTLTLFGENQLNGFFIQDTLGDGNPKTSDGIFIYGKQNVKAGDYVRLTGTVGEYNKRTQMSKISKCDVLRRNVAIPYTAVDFAKDVQGREEELECMALHFTSPLFVNETRGADYGYLTVGSTRHRAPTDYNLPKSEGYYDAIDFNAKDRISLNYGGTGKPATNPFTDAQGTCRTGHRIDNLKCVLDQISDQFQGEYRIYAAEGLPELTSNKRTAAPDEADLGAYDAKICGFNLEYFMNQNDLQRTRIVNAVKAINADIYGFVEVGGGASVIERLVLEMNNAKGKPVYDFLHWQGYEPTSTYTLNHIVFDSTQWEIYKDYYLINQPTPLNRKIIQALRNKKTGFTFVFSINHFKAKSGTGSGADADQGDGQGVYNNQRTREAYAVLDKLNLTQYYYGTDKILLMGDLNAFYREDPIRVFTDAGYIEQNHRFHDDSYTYCFSDYVQHLDYALATPAFSEYVTGVTVWHINADEPSSLDYDRDNTNSTGPYRCSDHDPVIVGFSIGEGEYTANEDYAALAEKTYARLLRVYPNPSTGEFRFFVEEAGQVEVRTLSGRTIYTASVGEGENTVDASSWAEGSYIVVFRSARGGVSYAKLLRI